MAQRKRTRRGNPSGLGVAPIALAIGAASAAASLIPGIAMFFKKETETPAFHFDPNKYAQDYSAALASQTQQAVAQRQAQAVVQAEQIKADSNRRLLIYGALGVAGVIGAVILISALRKKG